jgi:hypothetical protein
MLVVAPWHPITYQTKRTQLLTCQGQSLPTQGMLVHPVQQADEVMQWCQESPLIIEVHDRSAIPEPPEFPVAAASRPASAAMLQAQAGPGQQPAPGPAARQTKASAAAAAAAAAAAEAAAAKAAEEAAVAAEAARLVSLVALIGGHT